MYPFYSIRFLGTLLGLGCASLSYAADMVCPSSKEIMNAGFWEKIIKTKSTDPMVLPEFSNASVKSKGYSWKIQKISPLNFQEELIAPRLVNAKINEVDNMRRIDCEYQFVDPMTQKMYAAYQNTIAGFTISLEETTQYSIMPNNAKTQNTWDLKNNCKVFDNRNSACTFSLNAKDIADKSASVSGSGKTNNNQDEKLKSNSKQISQACPDINSLMKTPGYKDLLNNDFTFKQGKDIPFEYKNYVWQFQKPLSADSNNANLSLQFYDLVLNGQPLKATCGYLLVDDQSRSISTFRIALDPKTQVQVPDKQESWSFVPAGKTCDNSQSCTNYSQAYVCSTNIDECLIPILSADKTP